MPPQHSLFEDVPAGSRITEITPLPSDPNLRRVRVDGRKVATLRAADIAALNLTAGRAWTSALARQIDDAIAANKARKLAIGLLGRRAYSRGELIERLTRRGHDPAIAQRIADELEEDHWLDDAAYAETMARAVCLSRPASQDHVARRLVARGIDPELAERTAKAALTGQDPLQAALDFARRRFATMRVSGQASESLDEATAARRLAGLLVRRGFDEDVVHAVLGELGISPSDARDDKEI